MEKKAAIIVCAHNNEDVIERCLNSIRKQSFKNFTCILVDDSSTDRTVQIAKKYKWVRVIEMKKQSGPSICRNIAMKSVKGKYIATIDSDIILHEKWLERQIKFHE